MTDVKTLMRLLVSLVSASLLVACGQTSNTAVVTPAPSAPATSVQRSAQPSVVSPTVSASSQPAMNASDLVSVAAAVYPLRQGQYVTCDSGYAGSSRYASCPLTPRLASRLLTVFSGYISAPEPLGGGQDPEWPSESITADPIGSGGTAHVVLTKPGSPPSRYDLVIVMSGGRLLVDDLYCTGADPATSSVFADGWMNRSGC